MQAIQILATNETHDEVLLEYNNGNAWTSLWRQDNLDINDTRDVYETVYFNQYENPSVHATEIDCGCIFDPNDSIGHFDVPKQYMPDYSTADIAGDGARYRIFYGVRPV